jgi:GT2 family glycosyltransferase
LTAQPGATDATWAVVVNWNGGARNLACLAALATEGIPDARIAFVDNASTDGSREAVAAARPGVQVLRNAENVGFGHGANRGIRHALDAGAARVLLVNNDATLAEGALALLEAELDAHADVGLVAPRIAFAGDPRTLWCAGGRLTFRQNLSTLIAFRAPDGPEWRRTFDVAYVTGCVALVRREVFEQAGLFDGDFFAYHEDVELGEAAREKGFRSRVVGAALALHDAHGSTGGGYNARRKYMMAVNTVWFLRKHGSPARWLSFALFDVCTLPAVWLAHALRGEGAAALAKVRGTWDGLRGRRVTADVLRRF